MFAFGATNFGPYITLDDQATWIIGFAIQAGGVESVGFNAFAQTWDGLANTQQGQFGLNSDATIAVYRGAAEVARSTRSMHAGVWYYVEFKHIIANAGGTLEVRVNEEVWVTFAGDTQATANAFANQIRMHATIAGAQASWDDIYILDGTGAINNDYWGDTQVECLLPNGAGFYTELATLVGAATHWQAMNEVPPNDDTSYVADNVVGRRDTFTYTNLSLANCTIKGIQVLIRAREDVAGGVTIARMYRNAGVDNQGADTALNTTYHNWIREIMETDPIAIGAWTVANINAAEFGVRIRP